MIDEVFMGKKTELGPKNVGPNNFYRQESKWFGYYPVEV